MGADKVCKWMMTLMTGDKVDVAADAVIRGLTNLVENEVYRKAIWNHEKLIDILDVDFSDSQKGRLSVMHTCMIFSTILKKEGIISKQALLLKKLEKRVGYEHLASIRETYWRHSALLGATIFSEERSQLMNRFWNRSHFTNLQYDVRSRLHDDCLDFYLKLQSIKGEPFRIPETFWNADLVCSLFKKLYSSDLQYVNNVLMLLAAIAIHVRQIAYTNVFKMHFEILLYLLDTNDALRKKYVLNLFHQASEFPPKEKEVSLKGDNLLKFIELLKPDVDEQIVDIVSFIWNHFANVEETFVQANILPILLSIFWEKKRVQETTAEKIEVIVCEVLRNDKCTSETKFQVATSLSKIIEAEDSDDLHKLRFSLEICNTLVSSEGFIIHWLVDEGLEMVFLRISTMELSRVNNVETSQSGENPSSRRVKEIPANEVQPRIHALFNTPTRNTAYSSVQSKLKSIVLGIVNKLDVVREGNRLSKAFVLVLKSGDYCHISACELEPSFPKSFSDMSDVKYAGINKNVQLEKESLVLFAKVLRRTQSRKKSMDEFECLQLKVFTEEVFGKSSDLSITHSGILSQFAMILKTLDVSKEMPKTNQLCFLCIVELLKRKGILPSFFGDLSRQDGTSFIDCIMFWYTEYNGEIELHKSDTRNLLECISGRNVCPNCHSSYRHLWGNISYSGSYRRVKKQIICWCCGRQFIDPSF